MKAVDVPREYRKSINVNFPPHNRSDMIEGFAEKYFSQRYDRFNKYTYIPVWWTGWHVNHGYGAQKEEVRKFIQRLSKGKYFTVCQYDGGTLIDDTLTEKGCVTFVCDCVIPHNIIIPLLSDPHPCQRVPEPKLLCCFLASTDTHPVRKALSDMYSGKEGFKIGKVYGPAYKEIMCDSYFCLCPRGSGITSFRMYEAIQMGIIPIYISDIHRKPFENKIDWNSFSLTFKLDEIDKVEDAIRSIPIEKRNEMSRNCLKVYQEYFNYKSTCDEIIRILERL
jgi:hypothetical protein